MVNGCDAHVIADLIRNPEGKRLGKRHAEYPPDTTVAQARSRESGNLGGGAIRRVMLDLIQYPQGGWANTTLSNYVQLGPSFPRRRAVYGTRTIRWQHLSAESRESRRDSSETRQSTGRGKRHAEYPLPTTPTSLRT